MQHESTFGCSFLLQTNNQHSAISCCMQTYHGFDAPLLELFALLIELAQADANLPLHCMCI